MSLTGKLERDVEMKSPADKIMIALNVQKGGQNSIPGAVIPWNYTLDGEAKVAKLVMEEVNEVNETMKMKVIEGDILKDYNMFRLAVKGTPKGEGRVAHWTFEYEKKKPQTPAPNAFVDAAVQSIKEMDANIITQLTCN